jgi:hypothetical protein
VAFTRAVILSRGKVGTGELADFLAAGFKEQQVLEVLLGVSLATLCNFANNLAGSAINPELQALRARSPGIMSTAIRSQDDALAWVSAHAASLNEGAAHADEAISVLGAAGFFRIGVPSALGGSGGSTADAVDAIARVARTLPDRGLCLLGPAHFHRVPAPERQRSFARPPSACPAVRRAGRGHRPVECHEVPVGHREPVHRRIAGGGGLAPGWQLAVGHQPAPRGLCRRGGRRAH